MNEPQPEMPQFEPQPGSAEIDHEPPAAGFLLRAGAFMLDGFLIFLVQIAISLVFIVSGVGVTLGKLLGLLIPITYYTLTTVRLQGQTPGKRVAGIAVCRMDGTLLGYPRAAGRYLAYFLSSLPAGLGFLAAAFTDKKRALHDFVCDTRVVTVSEIGMGRKALLCVLPALALLIPVLLFVALMANPSLRSALLAARSGSSGGVSGVEPGGGLGELALKAQEGSAKANLGALRSALAIHYGDTEGQYPKDLSELVPKTLREMPELKLADHPPTGEVTAYGNEACVAGGSGGQIEGSRLQDSGKWGYVNDPNSPCWGSLFVDCTHADSSGKSWFSY